MPCVPLTGVTLSLSAEFPGLTGHQLVWPACHLGVTARVRSHYPLLLPFAA